MLISLRKRKGMLGAIQINSGSVSRIRKSYIDFSWNCGRLGIKHHVSVIPLFFQLHGICLWKWRFEIIRQNTQ
jgi:hypothetical protein